jgi:hypothetical protein
VNDDATDADDEEELAEESVPCRLLFASPKVLPRARRRREPLDMDEEHEAIGPAQRYRRDDTADNLRSEVARVRFCTGSPC